MASVIVYSPQGEPVKHTLPNARDLVAHAGWSWKQGKNWIPTEGAPYARPELAKAGDIAQQILDSVGGSAGKVTDAPDLSQEAVRPSDPVAILEDDEPAPVFEPEAAAEPEPAAEEASADADEATADDAAPRRGRRPKPAAE